ncbi:hypothetical protein EDB85DRAFT_2298454 [Lactarius pseudohatsudake]|nr:hypothetical protein EDB85DRAFT_2298454 [Lactarius pseudohatsudake]
MGMTIYALFAASAPSLDPLVGGFAAHVEGWRWTIWEIMWCHTRLAILLFPERSAAKLYRRARRLRKATGNPSVKSASEIAAAAMTPRDLAVDVLPKYTDKGELKLEERMPIAIVGASILPVCLFWFGWTSRASVHWILPIIGSSLFGTASFLLNYLADASPAYAASVLAGNDCIRSMRARSLALLACAFVLIPSLLYKYGEHIRMASKRALHDYNDD